MKLPGTLADFKSLRSMGSILKMQSLISCPTRIYRAQAVEEKSHVSFATPTFYGRSMTREKNVHPL